MNGRGNVPAALASGLAGEVVRTFGEVRLRVFGTSMAPSILPGDLISIQRAGLREIFPGEVVLFSQKGRFFVHRVVCRAECLDEPFAAQGEPCLITRGDRLCHNDPPVSSSELLGRVISIERDGRQVESTAQPSGWKRVIVRLLQTSDYATYAYVRLAALWGRFVGRTFASGAKAPNSLAMNVGAEAPTHKPNESFVAGLPTQDTEEVVECRV
jgi:signal peptidase I